MNSIQLDPWRLFLVVNVRPALELAPWGMTAPCSSGISWLGSTSQWSTGLWYCLTQTALGECANE